MESTVQLPTLGVRGQPRQRSPLLSICARLATSALVVCAVMVLALVGGLSLYGYAHAERIYEGVRVGGVDLGGMTEASAAAALEERFAAYANATLTLTAGSERFALEPAAAGAEFDAEASAAAAFAFGRSESIWERSRVWTRAFFTVHEIAPRVDVDVERLDARLRELAPRIVRPPVDAAIAMDGEGAPALVSDEPGVSFDLSASRAVLTRAFEHLDPAPVSLVTHPVAATITADQVAPSLEGAQRAVAAPLRLTGAGEHWTVSPNDLKRIVSVPRGGGTVAVNRAAVREVIGSIASTIDHPSEDAALVIDGDAIVVAPHVDAAEVEVESTVEAVVDALEGGGHAVEIVVTTAAPAITTAMAEDAAAEAEALIAHGLDLGWNDGQARLGRSDLLYALRIETNPEADRPFALDFDRDALTELLVPLADVIDQPVVEPRFRLVDDDITAVGEGKAGQALDIAASLDAVVTAIVDGGGSATLNVDPVKPAFTAASADTIKLPDVLGEASTYYGNSSEPRRQNVERASALEAGWLVAPGEEFSYAENVGKVDDGNGFVTGYGIVANEAGGVTTAPVVGGGICQVSTTIFQAAFWAGMPIVERHQHPYWLTTYGEPPRGMKGLDAMVNIEKDWALDLRFRNGTDDWIALVMIADGENVTARILGTNPGWKVEVDGPKVTNVVPKDDKMYFTQSSELKKGEELIVERAQEGFDTEILRTVSKNGTVIDEYAVLSSFLPSRNTTLRGTG